MMARKGPLWCLVGPLLWGLCNGLPINLENTAADSHTQLLTGLVAVLLTVCSVVLLAGCLCCQRKNGFKEFRDSPVVASTASNLDHGHVNPVANGEFTIFTPLSPPHQNNNVFLANQQIITRTPEDYGYDDVDVSGWFNGTDSDFPRIKLKYIKEIGKGWFGRVVEGAAQDVDSERKWTPVVVRILEATASSRERVVFLHDAAIYRCGDHPNVLGMIGRCLDTIPLLLLQEYCPQGDLKSYLRQNQATSDKLLSSEYPLVWCCQLTSALKHIHDNKLTHPDLAARNCQLTPNLTLKLGDYGLAVFQYPEDYYQGAPGVPLRWCAPESVTYTSTTIQPNKVTRQANIWSLAVTMWEICECGAQPYGDLTDDEVISAVLGTQNVRLGRPKSRVLHTDYMFRLMQLCWTSGESRPAVAQIDLMLTDLLQVYKNTKSLESEVSVEDFDERWQSFKPNTIVKTDNHVDSEHEIVGSKPLSPSLNNLHGSLDNLVDDSQMESWLENVATKTGDMSFVKGLSDAIKDLDNALALENGSSSDSSHQQSPAPEFVKTKTKLEFKLGPVGDANQADSSSDSFVQRTSSESETEEENWKKKIERGAYSEKVRQKSRSVADLMVLTHIEHSESDPETPLPSLDCRINYKNVRYAPRNNLENASLMFGSEGNLLSVKETFQEELKKLQEERKDSLLFVPEKRSQNSDSAVITDVPSTVSSGLRLEESPNKRILQELNSPSEIKPVSQVFNVFNVTIDKLSPVHLAKLDEIINFDDSPPKRNGTYEVPKLSDIIQSDSILVDYLATNPELKLDEAPEEVLYDSGVEGDKAEPSPVETINGTLIRQSATTTDPDFTTENKNFRNETETFEASHIKPTKILLTVPKLVDLIQDNDELMNYIIAKYETENVEKALDEAITELCDDEESDDDVAKTKSFLLEEREKYEDSRPVPSVTFDLSLEQVEALPNSLTHSTVFTSSPYGKKSLQELSASLPHQDGFTSLQLFGDAPEKAEEGTNLYSLETWDTFLGKTLDDQNESQENGLFDSFSSEPHSLLFIENETSDNSKENESSNTTYSCDERNNLTFTIEKDVVDVSDVHLEVEDPKNQDVGTWENSGGWFLHPQSTIEDVSGEMAIPAATVTDSYVGFNMDDEIMAAIRTELLNKLPQAQGASNGGIPDDDDWETMERSEVFLRYNVYNTPLSPIPEESLFEDNSGDVTPRQQASDEEDEDSDWSERCEPEILPRDAESSSAQTAESPARGPHHRHTPSQDSCCSNDTLFNLEELNVNEDRDASPTPKPPKDDSSDGKLLSKQTPDESVIHNVNGESVKRNDNETEEVVVVENKNYLKEFLMNERDFGCVKVIEVSDESSSTTTEQLLPFAKQVAPLPSPEDKPWKELAESLLSHNKMLPTTETVVPESDVGENETVESHYDDGTERGDCYESVTDMNDIYNEADYVNIVNLENTKNSAEFTNKKSGVIEDQNGDCINGSDYVNSYDQRNALIISNDDDEEEHDVFGVLSDIRFSGPGDSQLMTTSFSESNDLNDDQDWDSGSDTRSSSSGEFIWKEGEHEESLKALRAAPQDVLEDIHPMEEIQEETSSESSGSDEEGESPEFVPSAWDKYATPAKSAMRSPEKTLEKTEPKKSKGVWFKKQKYHCVYEYPREPDSPVLHSYDLWKPQDYSAFADWELDASDPLALPLESSDDIELSHCYRPKHGAPLNLYQLSSITDFASSGMDEEFFVSSSTRPFDKTAGLSSQFFPGNWMEASKQAENVTPDSGVEDITPAGFNEADFARIALTRPRNVPTLKVLATEAVEKTKKVELRTSDVLGGLRHTRNKLKLDLPPSPSAFTSSKMFSIEPVLDAVVHREKPTFTTFGKHRFQVQHVDTPPGESSDNKNVSFEALPHKPLHKINDFDGVVAKNKVEVVRGEASLLDSADEDSGIESSTLERKLSSSVG